MTTATPTICFRLEMGIMASSRAAAMPVGIRKNCSNHECFQGPRQLVSVGGGRDRTSRRAGCHFCRYLSHARSVCACSTMEHREIPNPRSQNPNPNVEADVRFSLGLGI